MNNDEWLITPRLSEPSRPSNNCWIQSLPDIQKGNWMTRKGNSARRSATVGTYGCGPCLSPSNPRSARLLIADSFVERPGKFFPPISESAVRRRWSRLDESPSHDSATWALVYEVPPPAASFRQLSRYPLMPHLITLSSVWRDLENPSHD
jgi:hypothetical protein